MAIAKTEKTDLRKNIRELYAQVEKKHVLQEVLATEFGLETMSVKNNWFGPIYGVPKKYRERVIEILQNTIALQNKTA